MKKILCLLGIASLFTLTGCSDAHADISTGDKAIITVGDKKITNKDVYNTTKKSYGSSLVLNRVMTLICDNEKIELDDAMKKQADEQVATFKTQAGEAFTAQLETYGYKDEEEFKKGDIYPALRQNALVKKYVTSKQKDMFATYKPVQATILEAGSKENATAALSAIKEGMSFSDAVTKYGVSDSYKGENATYVTKSGLPTALFDKMSTEKKNGLVDSVIEDTTNKKFYVVDITNNDPTKFEEEAITTIVTKGGTEVQTVANAYYLKKYEFKIYDKDIYDGIKSTNASYIIQ
ncbi:MAG: hypothetical protein RR766_04700 [Longicatena sp.]